MASSRIAFGAVLSTVTDTANAVSGVVNTISNSLDMANNFVRHQQNQQRKNYALDDKLSDRKRHISAAQEMATLRKSVAEMLQDPEIAGYYNEEYALLADLFSEAKA